MRATPSGGQTVASNTFASCADDNLAGGPERSYIALLEDDVDQATLVCRWLRLDGVACRWFRTANEMYAQFEAARAGQSANPPHLVLCDWQLADTDADAVLATLAAGHALPCPVIVMSAHTDPARRAATLQAGASAWLSKPVSREALRRTLAQYW